MSESSGTSLTPNAVAGCISGWEKYSSNCHYWSSWVLLVTSETDKEGAIIKDLTVNYKPFLVFSEN